MAVYGRYNEVVFMGWNSTNKVITGHHPVQVKSEHPIQRVIRLVEEPIGWVKAFCRGRQIRINPENYQMGYHIITRYDQISYDYQIWKNQILPDMTYQNCHIWSV
jgi:hypothetical protein